MGTEIDIFGNKARMPAKLRERFEDRTNLDDIQTAPSLSYEGKVWAITIEGEKQRLVKVDEDGDEAPISTMRVVILDFNKRRGRAYYEGSYDPDRPGSPLCWSDDGILPHPSVPEATKDEITSHKCENCPMAVKGSRVSDNGKEVTACSQHRMLAVMPANWLGKENAKPLRMKIAVTSDYDKQSPELEAKHWFAFQQYRKYLQNNQVNFTGMVVTKMKFDPTVAYPKIVFSPDRWVEPDDEADFIENVLDSGEVEKVLAGYTPEGPDGKDREQVKEKEEKKQPPKESKKTKPADDDDGEIELDPEPPKRSAKKAAPKKEAPKKVEADLDDWDEDEDEGSNKKAASGKKEAPAEDKDAAAATDDELDDILSDWEGDD